MAGKGVGESEGFGGAGDGEGEHERRKVGEEGSVLHRVSAVLASATGRDATLLYKRQKREAETGYRSDRLSFFGDKSANTSLFHGNNTDTANLSILVLD